MQHGQKIEGPRVEHPFLEDAHKWTEPPIPRWDQMAETERLARHVGLDKICLLMQVRLNGNAFWLLHTWEALPYVFPAGLIQAEAGSGNPVGG